MIRWCVRFGNHAPPHYPLSSEGTPSPSRTLGGTAKGKKKNFVVFPLSLSFFLLTFSLSGAGAVEVNRQLDIPLNNGTQGEARDEADMLLRLGGQAQDQGHLDKAIAYWLQALKIYQQIGDDAAIGRTYDYLGLTYASLGRYKQAEDLLRRRLAVARDRQDFQGQIYGLNNLGTVLLQGGHAQAAQEIFSEARAVARSVSNLPGEGLSLSNLGLAAAGFGDYNQAIKRYEAALSLRQRIPDPLGEANTLNNLGDAYRAVKDYRQAQAVYREALELAQESRDRSSVFRAYDGLVASYTALGLYDVALKAINQRLALAQQVQSRNQELIALRLYARLYRDTGNYLESRRFYHQAISLARALGEEQTEAFLRNELAQILYLPASRYQR